jgi:hypothetical protein
VPTAKRKLRPAPVTKLAVENAVLPVIVAVKSEQAERAALVPPMN